MSAPPPLAADTSVAAASRAHAERMLAEHDTARGFFSLLERECVRVLKIWTQTIAAPVLTGLLYFAVFGVAALLFGLPIFFDAGLVVFLPIIFSVATRFGGSVLLYALPAAGAFAAMHAIVPPHPGPVTAATEIGASYILRGIRSAPDYEYERGMRHMNAELNGEITTIFLMPPRELSELSSSMVKGLVGPEGWEEHVQKLVPAPVFEAMKREG